MHFASFWLCTCSQPFCESAGAGDFQLSKIDVLKDPYPINERKGCNSMDLEDIHGIQVINTLLSDPLNQEPLLAENVPDPLAGEQTWPTEEEMAEADANNKERKIIRKKIPQGTSDYQAAWIVEDTDNEDSGSSEEEDDGMVLDGQKDNLVEEKYDHSDIDENSNIMENLDEATEADTEMADDENLTKEQIEAEIKKIKDANAEDEEFPDEVDTPIDVPAKKRFAKYRGLKSFRTSTWDPKESLPPEYARIFAFDNFARTQKHVLAKVLDIDQGSMNDCAPVGTYVRLHVKDVPIDVSTNLCLLSKKLPVVASGLLQHEMKMSVLHFSIKKHDSYDAPIKSKEMFIFHVGFRQFFARPLFSSDNINSDKHKMERFLHPGRFSIASVYAPICFPPLPLIVLKNRHGEAPSIAATSSLRSVDPDWIILKKIILTGSSLDKYSPLEWSDYFDKEEDVTILGTNNVFHVYMAGSKGPVVFCLHGGGYSGLSFALSASKIKERAQVVAMDLRGHGMSSTDNDLDLSIETLCNDVLAVLKTIYGNSPPAIILVGHSYLQRVSKLKATVRFMFHNPDDVRWFKPVDVWTKCGRRGRIKEPVGTHGAMKCL